MVHPPRKCAYCGEQGSTKEHYWGRRSNAFLPPTGDKYTLHEKVRFDGKQKIIEIKARPGKPRSRSLRIACKACNNGWMREIYDIPVLALAKLAQGEWWPLSVQEKKDIANWAALFTMTYEHRDKKTQATSFSERELFMKSRQLDINWSVWLSEVEIDHNSPDKIFHTGIEIITDGADQKNKCNTQSTTITFGRLLVHTFSCSANVRFKSEDYGKNLGLQEIWPADNFVIRKPERPCSIKEVRLIADFLMDYHERIFE